MEKTTKQKGNITELECLLAFEKRGVEVSVPWGENTRYDMIIDVNNQLYKIQCKTSHETKGGGSFMFATCSTRLNTQGSSKAYYSKEEIDFFATSFNNNIYLIPVEECISGGQKTIRYDFPKANIFSKINWHENYLLDNFLENNMKPQDILLQRIKENCIEYNNDNDKMLSEKSKKFTKKQVKVIEKSVKREPNLCIDCGQPTKDRTAIRCSKCNRAHTRQFDRQAIAERCKEVEDIKKVADEFGGCRDTVIASCKDCGVKIISYQEIAKKKYGIKVKNIEKNIVFDSTRDGARWLIDNNYSKSKSPSGPAQHIREVCTKKKENAYGFHWQYVD